MARRENEVWKIVNKERRGRKRTNKNIKPKEWKNGSGWEDSKGDGRRK